MTDGEEAANAAPTDRGVARRQAFLEAARGVFLEHGYEVASVNDVVRIAGGSLATLYSQFGNKEGLFLAVFEDQYTRFARDITPTNFAHLPLEQGLCVMGEQFVRAMLAPEHLAFFRIAVGGARTHPELLQRFLVTGRGRLREVLITYMQTARTSSGAKITDPTLAATFFAEVLRAGVHYEALASDSFKISDSELTEHVRRAVGVLLNGVLPRP